MCGRFTLVKTSDIKNRLKIQHEVEVLSAYNIAPISSVAVNFFTDPTKLKQLR